MKTFLTSVIFLLFFSSAMGQTGDYLITHTKPDFPNIDHLNFNIIQDQNGLICIANRSGILRYDGVNWELIATPSAVLSLTIDDNNILFAGCLNEFGKVDFSDKKYEYISLSEGIDTHNDLFDQSLYHNGKIYFISESKVIEYDPESGEKEITYELRDDIQYLNYVFELNDSLYINFSDNSISLLSSIDNPDSAFYMPDSSSLVFVNRNRSTGIYLAGTYDGNLFTFDGQKALFLSQSNKIIQGNHEIIDGTWINEELFGVGTLDNGCFIFNINDSAFIEHINFKNGLPDDEVFTMYSDLNHGLWIAHEFGLSRIVPEIPIKSFSNYQGLEGNPISLNNIKGKLYVTTSTGTYYFDQVKDYKNVVYYVMREKKTSENKKSTRKKETVKEQPIKEKKKKERKSFLGFGRKKKDKQQQEASDESKPGLVKRIFSGKDSEKPKEKRIRSIKRTPEKNYEYIRRTRKELVSSRYVYKAIKGLDTKCVQISEYQKKILVSSPSGVYEIAGDSATQIISEAVQYMFVSPDHKHLVLSCYDRSVRIYEFMAGLWIELDIIQFDEMILSIYEDLEDRLWLGSPNLIYLAHRTDTSIVLDNEFPYSNNYFNTPLITHIDQKTYFINNQGYFYYEDYMIKRDMDIVNKIGFPVSYSKTRDGNAWIYNGKVWYLLEDSGEPIAFEYLSLFPNLTYIQYSPSQDKYWLISGDNNIYVFDPNFEDDEDYVYNNLIFKAVRTNVGILKNEAKFQLRYDENTLTFEIVQPDYLGLLNIEYQFMLDGMMVNWSEWIKGNFINFNYLQPGIYTLKVRSRDTFGRIQESNPINFTIRPPYWKTPWFYATELVFFLGLVILSIRLNRQNVKYRFVTAGLSILTLIMIIEFIQSATQGYLGIQSTPIIDFGINVGIALFVFPLEQLLRKYMIGSRIPK